jgi:multidrug efflux pump subunit AcrA (membrane-fusion protein)
LRPAKSIRLGVDPRATADKTEGSPRSAMKLPKLILPLILVAAIGLSGCEREKAPPLAAAAPQVIVATVEARDVPIIDEWIGRLDGSANVDIRARVQATSRRLRLRKGRW